MSSPGQHDPGRDDPGGPAPEWSDPEWGGPGSRGRYRHGQPSGREPLTARSPLRLRAILSAVALVGAVAAAILFALGADGDGAWAAAAICTMVALIAAVDLVVIAKRSRT
ncbi:DUF6343 family protein [Actinomadura welshii]